jgi:hypothetical protein
MGEQLSDIVHAVDYARHVRSVQSLDACGMYGGVPACYQTLGALLVKLFAQRAVFSDQSFELIMAI